MLERYSHIRMAAKRTAMDSIMLHSESIAPTPAHEAAEAGDSNGVPTKLPTIANAITVQ